MPRTTVVNRRHEQFDVYIGRGSIFGNPWTSKPLKLTIAVRQASSRKEAIEFYRLWLHGLDFFDFCQTRRQDILRDIHLLAGKRLGCYCSPLPCHGDILVDLTSVYEPIDPNFPEELREGD